MICGEFFYLILKQQLSNYSNNLVITSSMTCWGTVAVFYYFNCFYQCELLLFWVQRLWWSCWQIQHWSECVTLLSCICGGPKLEKCPTDMKTALKLPALQLTEQTGKGQSVGQSDPYLLHRSDLRVIDLLSLWRGGVDGLKVLPKGVEEKGKGGKRGKGEAKRRVKDREESRK